MVQLETNCAYCIKNHKKRIKKSKKWHSEMSAINIVLFVEFFTLCKTKKKRCKHRFLATFDKLFDGDKL